jgi:hypothetical protein
LDIAEKEPMGAADAAQTHMIEPHISKIIAAPQRDGILFVLSPTCALPTRCVKCNAECGPMRMARRISTLSPWYPLFSSAGWNAHCADERPIDIAYSLCLRHRMQALGRGAIIGFIGLANIFCWVDCRYAASIRPVLEILAIALPLILLATALTFRPILRPRRVHHGRAWFAGAGEEFLSSLREPREEPVRESGAEENDQLLQKATR